MSASPPTVGVLLRGTLWWETDVLAGGERVQWRGYYCLRLSTFMECRGQLDAGVDHPRKRVRDPFPAGVRGSCRTRSALGVAGMSSAPITETASLHPFPSPSAVPPVF